MIVYVSGPISGYEGANEPAFRRAADLLRSRGHMAVVPLDIAPWKHPGQECPPGYTKTGHSSACHLRGDLMTMLRCDAVKLLTGWELSRGARLEWSVATDCGLQIFYPAQWPLVVPVTTGPAL